MLVYPTMQDETIAPTLYRTGRGDRSVPLVLGTFLALAAPALGWFSGPFFWSWGLPMTAVALLGAGAFLRRWRLSSRSVLWDETRGCLQFRSGSRVRTLPWSELTRVVVSPSSVRTQLWAGKSRYVLSHRLVRAEVLLDKLRSQRPDLFPNRVEPLVFHRSSISAVLQGLLALGTGGTGVLLWPWQPWLAGLFLVAAAYVVTRVFFFIPRRFEIQSSGLTTRYWLRRRTWGRPRSLREDGYAAGGAVFFRMTLDYGPSRVVLDDGQLLESLRPQAGQIVHLLCGPIPSSLPD